MRKIFLILLLIPVTGFSQGYMNDIVEETCDCISKISDTTSMELLQMKLGGCMMEASKPYKKQLQKDYDVNFDQMDRKEGEKLGKIVGMKMASICPNELLRLTTKLEKFAEPENNEQKIKGVVTKIETDLFVVFFVKDPHGLITKYCWLTFIDSKTELTGQYNSLVGKPVNLSYKSEQYFDPKINEYRLFNIITKLELLEE